MRLTLALGLLPLVLLAGCQSEASRLASARTEALAKCNNEPNIKAGMPGMDTGRFCTCLINKIFEGRSAADIAKLDNDAEAQRVGTEGSMQCMAEQASTIAPAAGTPAAVAPPVTPQPAQDAAAETVEEAGDEVE